MILYAHSGKETDRSDWELLDDHARAVADGAERRAVPFGGGALARRMGLLHDLGKAKGAFQRRLSDETIKVGHAAEGALAAAGLPGWSGVLLAPGILGHHNALPNVLDMRKRLKGVEALALPDGATGPVSSLPDWIGGREAGSDFRHQFLARMLYACLVEADDRETAAFYAALKGEPRKPEDRRLTPEMREAFHAHMAGFGGKGAVDGPRRTILDHALGQAAEPPGAFTMTVPTGGGKTLASLGFALEHAAAHGMRRLIYVIPYTSIVEQTAAVYRDVLGKDAVLEHHANYDWSENAADDDEARDRRYAAESWDAPVVVTTAVQFFESLYAARKKRCRKLAALPGSVIVIDEAQTMPRDLLRPCLAALNELMAGYGVSVVLSTATQPVLTREAGLQVPEALTDAREIAPDRDALYAAFRRVTVRDIGAQDDDALAERMRGAERALLIVDNREQARGLFDRMEAMPGARHLSTLMTPEHRRRTLAAIREDLKAGAPVRLVSTSLIEAGVDVDFPLVLRAATGLDSIAQAAGRCNREGRDLGPDEVLVFRSEHPSPPEVAQRAEAGIGILERFADDPLAPEAITAYFNELLLRQGTGALDARTVKGSGGSPVKGILAAIRKAGRSFRFADVADAFRMIEETQRDLIILDGLYGMPEDMRDRLSWGSASAFARAAQPYTIPVPWSVWNALRDAGAVAPWKPECFDDQFHVLTSSEAYCDRAGLQVEGFEKVDLFA